MKIDTKEFCQNFPYLQFTGGKRPRIERDDAAHIKRAEMKRQTRRQKLLVLAASGAILSGCSHALGYAGAHPGEVSCKGKATVSMMGTGIAGAGIVGNETNSGAITFDCGDGAYLKQGAPTPDTAAPAKTP